MESEALIIKALLDQGGLIGLASAIYFVWTLINNKKNKDIDVDFSAKQQALVEKLNETKDKYEEKIKILEKDYIKLQKDFKNKNDEVLDVYVQRIDDLKKLISDYHDLASDTLQTLEQIKFNLKENDNAKKDN